MNATEQMRQEDLERLRSLRYMDDDFMTVCLADNFEGVELILQIILGKRNIKVKSVRTQEQLKNLQGRSATLDVHAVDSDNREFFSCTNPDDMNYEALAKKARYFKQDEKGVAAMCKIMEDMRNEKEKEVRIDNALRMIKDGELPLEKIALYSGLSVDEVRGLAAPVIA